MRLNTKYHACKYVDNLSVMDRGQSIHKIRVAIDARLPDSGQGGVQQVIVTIAEGMKSVPTMDIGRYWLVLEGTTWWKTVLPSQDHVIQVRPPFGKLSLKLSNNFPKIVSQIFPILSRFFNSAPPYDELLGKHRIDVVHLPFQDGFNTNLPYIYHPHDLQHKYFPEFFSKQQIRHRETQWKKKAQNATLVMAASPFVVKDFENYWSIESKKISLIPIPPPSRITTDEGILTLVPKDYAIYPAAFWPHKNHQRLLEAVKILKESGYELPVVLTGSKTGEYTNLRKFVDDSGLEDLVIFLGHVSNEQLTSLVANAQLMVVPSLFEAMSLTVWDAQKLGTAVVCSGIEPFLTQVHQSALTFDPLDPTDIASVLKRVWKDKDVKDVLIDRGLTRTQKLNQTSYGLAILGQYLKVMGLPVPSQITAATNELVGIYSGA